MHSRRWLMVMWVALTTAALGADKRPAQPQPGQTFVFSPDAPKYMTCNIDFRDSTGTLWPNFVGGRGMGQMVFEADGLKGAFTITFDRLNQKNGDQQRRVLGERIKPDQPFVVTLTVKSMGALKEGTLEETDGKGKVKTRTALTTVLSGTLDVAGQSVPFEAQAEVRANAGKNRERPESLYLAARWRLEGKALGLTAVAGSVDVFAGLTAFEGQQMPGSKK